MVKYENEVNGIKISLMSEIRHGYIPPFALDIERRNMLIGINGSGKSQLIKKIAEGSVKINVDEKIIPIERIYKLNLGDTHWMENNPNIFQNATNISQPRNQQIAISELYRNILERFHNSSFSRSRIGQGGMALSEFFDICINLGAIDTDIKNKILDDIGNLILEDSTQALNILNSILYNPVDIVAADMAKTHIKNKVIKKFVDGSLALAGKREDIIDDTSVDPTYLINSIIESFGLSFLFKRLGWRY